MHFYHILSSCEPKKNITYVQGWWNIPMPVFYVYNYINFIVAKLSSLSLVTTNSNPTDCCNKFNIAVYTVVNFREI